MAGNRDLHVRNSCGIGSPACFLRIRVHDTTPQKSALSCDNSRHTSCSSTSLFSSRRIRKPTWTPYLRGPRRDHGSRRNSTNLWKRPIRTRRPLGRGRVRRPSLPSQTHAPRIYLQALSLKDGPNSEVRRDREEERDSMLYCGQDVDGLDCGGSGSSSCLSQAAQ